MIEGDNYPPDPWKWHFATILVSYLYPFFYSSGILATKSYFFSSRDFDILELLLVHINPMSQQF